LLPPCSAINPTAYLLIGDDVASNHTLFGGKVYAPPVLRVAPEFRLWPEADVP
jgi:hypothetical protein